MIKIWWSILKFYFIDTHMYPWILQKYVDIQIMDTRTNIDTSTEQKYLFNSYYSYPTLPDIPILNVKSF